MTHSAILVAVMAAVTILLRALPFLIFGGGRKTPSYILYLGRVLPQAIIGMLVVYCLREVQLTQNNRGLPEALAVAGVILLQAWKRNSLLSILGGTVIYMVLVQAVFA